MDNLKSWNLEKGPNFVNCPNFVTIFCGVLKWKYFFFYIPSYPPPIAVRNSCTNQFYQKNWRFCIFSTKKKVTSLNRDIHPGDSWPYVRPLPIHKYHIFNEPVRRPVQPICCNVHVLSVRLFVPYSDRNEIKY